MSGAIANTRPCCQKSTASSEGPKTCENLPESLKVDLNLVIRPLFRFKCLPLTDRNHHCCVISFVSHIVMQDSPQVACISLHSDCVKHVKR